MLAPADLADERREAFSVLKVWIIRKNMPKIPHISKSKH
jgi:hypothetical protein